MQIKADITSLIDQIREQKVTKISKSELQASYEKIEASYINQVRSTFNKLCLKNKLCNLLLK